MVNVQVEEPESGIEVVDLDLNPVDKFKMTDDDMVEYLLDKKVIDYTEKTEKPICTTYKIVLFADKDCGKTHCAHTLSELNANHGRIIKSRKTGKILRKEGVKYDECLSQVKFLLERGDLQSGTPIEYFDLEGKGYLMNVKGKFKGYHIRYRDEFYPDGPLPTMQDPTEVVGSLVKFFKSAEWAHNHPDIARMMTMCERYPEGIPIPNAVVVENYSILTDSIMNYVRTMSHDDKIDKITSKGQLLGAPIIKKFDNWDIRNSNWNYIGGYGQRLPLHFIATARSRNKWKHDKPSDEEDIDQYKRAKFDFNCVVYLYKKIDAVSKKVTFYAQIVECDFMDHETELKPIENPSIPKIVAELCKYSHNEILDKHGKWIEKEINGEMCEIWVENDSTKTDKPSKTKKSTSKKKTAKLSKKSESEPDAEPTEGEPSDTD